VTAKAQLKSAFATLVFEDLPEAIIDISYLFSSGKATPILMLSLVTTFLHTFMQIGEIRAIRRFLPANAAIAASCEYANQSNKEARYKLTSDELILAAAQVGHNWEEFNCEFRGGLSATAIIKAASAGGTKVRKLSVFMCKQIDGAAMAHISEHTKNLKELFLPGCAVDNIGIRALVENCGKSLELIAMGVCSNLDQDTLPLIAGGLPNLKTLFLIKNPMWVDDEGMIAMIRGGLHSLQTAALSWCPKITDATLFEMGRAGLPELSRLDLIDCSVTQEGVLAVVRGCPKLVKIVLAITPGLQKNCDAVRPGVVLEDPASRVEPGKSKPKVPPPAKSN